MGQKQFITQRGQTDVLLIYVPQITQKGQKQQILQRGQIDLL